MAKPSVDKIKKSLLEQLEKKGGMSPFFVSLIEDYCNWEMTERNIWSALKGLQVNSKEWESLQKLALNVSNRKMCILKQLDFKTTNVIGGDDEEL